MLIWNSRVSGGWPLWDFRLGNPTRSLGEGTLPLAPVGPSSGARQRPTCSATSSHSPPPPTVLCSALAPGPRLRFTLWRMTLPLPGVREGRGLRPRMEGRDVGIKWLHKQDCQPALHFVPTSSPLLYQVPPLLEVWGDLRIWIKHIWIKASLGLLNLLPLKCSQVCQTPNFYCGFFCKFSFSELQCSHLWNGVWNGSTESKISTQSCLKKEKMISWN